MTDSREFESRYDQSDVEIDHRTQVYFEIELDRRGRCGLFLEQPATGSANSIDEKRQQSILRGIGEALNIDGLHFDSAGRPDL